MQKKELLLKNDWLMMYCEGMATNAVCDSVFYFLLIQKKKCLE